jgi:hypothetical protein
LIFSVNIQDTKINSVNVDLHLGQVVKSHVGTKISRMLQREKIGIRNVFGHQHLKFSGKSDHCYGFRKFSMNDIWKELPFSNHITLHKQIPPDENAPHFMQAIHT